MTETICKCGITHRDIHTYPINCPCGAKIEGESSQRPQPPPRQPRARKQPAGEPGTELLQIMPTAAKVWASLSGGCGCEDYARQMDIWGVDGCLQRHDEIVRHLVCKAPPLIRKLESTKQTATSLLDQAIELARIKAALPEVQHLITFDDLTRDTLTLSQMILRNHPDVSGIAGVPRSGMRAACDVAIRLGVPLYEASYEGLRICGGGGGGRIRNHQVHGKRKEFTGPVVLVDDSTCSGYSLKELRTVPDLAKMPAYVIYAASPGRTKIDGFVHALELPHWFDWNLLNNGQVLKQKKVGIDFDGVLCNDCLAEDDDDGDRYTAWMTTVQPIRFPRDYRVPFIITARREAYRSITEAWLAKYRINYGELIMYPHTFAERQQTDIGAWKAEQCERVGVGLFIESDYWQASRIAEIRERPVISIARN